MLLAESIAALALRDDGIYVDGTFGRGGHARAILALLGPGGRLVAVDRDPDALAFAASIDDPRFAFRHAQFADALVKASAGIVGIFVGQLFVRPSGRMGER